MSLISVFTTFTEIYTISDRSHTVTIHDSMSCNKLTPVKYFGGNADGTFEVGVVVVPVNIILP